VSIAVRIIGSSTSSICCQGLGSQLLQCLIDEARSARVALQLTVLEVNPARRFYERYGFIVTHTISPRHHMEWRGR
jgi:ribosomal protein S18 acetylase RimI-like enzyme